MTFILMLICALFLAGCHTPNIPDFPTTTTTTIPPDAQDFDMSKVQWLSGPNPTRAVVNVKASNLRLVPGAPLVGLDWSAHTWEPNDGFCDGAWAFLWKKDGAWYGAYLEWTPMGQAGHTAHDALLNMYHNDAHKPFPVSGDACGVFIMSRDGKQRSNVVLGTWPLDDDGVTPMGWRMR